jgi:hypothetical protein
MATKKKQPEVPHLITPWALVLFQDVDCWFHALMRTEFQREQRGRAGEATIPGRVVGTHLLYTEGSGAVRYEERPGADAGWARPVGATTRTTSDDFLTYLRGRLLDRGGSTDAYRTLGVDRPAPVVREAPPEVQAGHDELYDRAARLLEIPEEELRKRYAHLNTGLQMMNLRNRLRGAGHAV